MAILFSKVLMRDDNSESEFFVSGFPQDSDDLEGWNAYHDFLDDITEDMVVNVHAVAFLYGEGETVRATPEEVAYMAMRDERDHKFLTDHCDCIGESDFNVNYYADELSEIDNEEDEWKATYLNSLDYDISDRISEYLDELKLPNNSECIDYIRDSWIDEHYDSIIEYTENEEENFEIDMEDVESYWHEYVGQVFIGMEEM